MRITNLIILLLVAITCVGIVSADENVTEPVYSLDVTLVGKLVYSDGTPIYPENYELLVSSATGRIYGYVYTTANGEFTPLNFKANYGDMIIFYDIADLGLVPLDNVAYIMHGGETEFNYVIPTTVTPTPTPTPTTAPPTTIATPTPTIPPETTQKPLETVATVTPAIIPPTTVTPVETINTTGIPTIIYTPTVTDGTYTDPMIVSNAYGELESYEIFGIALEWFMLIVVCGIFFIAMIIYVIMHRHIKDTEEIKIG